MQKLKEKVQAIIEKYEEALAAKGIRITMAKRYFEVEVREEASLSTAGMYLLNCVENHFDKKREKKKGYKHQPNRYHCIILRASPVDSKLVSKERCREYAFVLRKIERAHVGLAPEKRTCKENKLLQKIEKRILKILKRAERHRAQRACKDTLRDAFRYTFSNKYEYKRTILERDRLFWEILFAVCVGALAILIVCAAWVISALCVDRGYT